MKIVILGCRTERLGVAAAKTLLDEGLKVEYRNLDVSSSDSILAFAAGMTKDYGVIDVLINNAAILFNSDHFFPEAARGNFFFSY